METASFTGLIKALVWIFFIYYGLKFVMRLLAPYFLQQVVKKAEENFKQQQQYQQQQSQTKSQSSPHAEMPKEKKKVGEYIDYEEIE